MTTYKPIFQSPISSVAALEGVASEVTLSDLSGITITLIQGNAGPALTRLASKTPSAPGEVVDLATGLLARLTLAETYLFGKVPGLGQDLGTALASDLSQGTGVAHMTDLTHGKAALKLSGPAAATVLSKICGLDFHDNSFPNMQVKQTSAAKIKTLIVRCDENERPVYHLHVGRPFGQYFWDTILDAGREFGMVTGA